MDRLDVDFGFDAEPGSMPSDEGIIGGAKWAQAGDGKWYRFASYMGPGTTHYIPHPEDPNWWRHDDGTWACRHGWLAGYCKANILGSPCGDVPPPERVVTEEELDQTVQGLQRLLQSMET